MLFLSAKHSRSVVWWEDSMRKTFWRTRNGPVIPFGSLVECYLNFAKDQSRIHQFGMKVLPGLFLGYALYAGGIWKGDVLVADLEELATMDASEIYSERLNAEEVVLQEQIENSFSSRRTSTLMRDHPIRGEGQRDFLGDSEGSPPSPLQDSYPVAG